MKRLVVLAASLGLLAPGIARGAGTMLIWPVNPTIAEGRAAGAIWLENRGVEPAVVQIRLFAWRQGPAGDDYRADETIVASPPMATIRPGARQLVRLTDTRTGRPGGEQAFRVIVDEVPTKPADAGAAVRFQMRYSLPLFVYGGDSDGDGKPQPRLACRIVRRDGDIALHVVNEGARHARLTNASITGGRDAMDLGPGLFGYALGHGVMTRPISSPLPERPVLGVDVDGRDRAQLPCA